MQFGSDNLFIQNSDFFLKLISFLIKFRGFKLHNDYQDVRRALSRVAASFVLGLNPITKLYFRLPTYLIM